MLDDQVNFGEKDDTILVRFLIRSLIASKSKENISHVCISS